MNERNKLKLRINIARGNLLFFAILSAINLILPFLGAGFYIPYSSFICKRTMVLVFLIRSGEATDLSAEEAAAASTPALIFGVILAILVLSFLLLCYFKSKNSRVWMNSALVFGAVDTLSLLFAIVSDGSAALYLIDLIMHALMLFYTVRGVTAYSKLKSLAPAEEVIVSESSYESFPEEPTGEPDGKINSSDIGSLYNNDGKQIAAARYKDLNVVAARRAGSVVIVVNGFIRAECDFEAGGAVSLSADAGGVKLLMYYSEENETKCVLTADGEIIN